MGGGVTGVVATAAAVVLGIATGAMLLIGVVLVPFWRAQPPATFRAWFAAWAPRLGRLMRPLGGGAALLAFAAAWLRAGGPGAGAAWTAAAGALGVVGVTLAVNERANARFLATPAPGDGEVRALLARWAAWHWVRIASGLVATWAAVRAAGAAP
jgi:hypothetical protein